MKDFLKHFIKEQPGDVLNVPGEVIGHHEGALFYTLGERRGFTITAKTTEDKPYFVVAKDFEKNTLTVSNEKYEASEDGLKVPFKQTNWINEVPDPEKIYMARVRYRGTLHEVKIKSLPNNKAEMFLMNSKDIVSSGQSIVVYDSDTCMGGGIID